MKSALLLAVAFLCLLCFSSCSTREPVQILEEYEVPFVSDKKYVYYYFRSPENDTSRTEFTTTYQHGEKYVTEETFVGGRLEGLRKFKVTSGQKELVDEVFYSLDSATNMVEPVKAEIVEYSNREDNKAYPTGRYEKVYRMWAGFSTRIKTVETFIGEEPYRFNGEDVPSLKFDSRHLVRSYNQYAPIFWWTENFDGHVIFSKGIGLTYAMYASDDKKSEHTLIGWETAE